MKLHKSGFLPRNKTKFSWLFFTVKVLFIVFLLVYSINSLVRFLPVKGALLCMVGLVLFSLLLATKILQGLCLYQNVLLDLYDHQYSLFQKILICVVYAISLVILPMSFMFLVMQYNEFVNVDKFKVLNKSVAIFFIASIMLFFIFEGIFSTVSKGLALKIQYTMDELKSDDNSLKERFQREGVHFQFNSEYLKNRKIESYNSRHNEKFDERNKGVNGYYYLNKGSDIKDELKYRITKIIGVVVNLLDISLLSVNSIDFVKNNGIEFVDMSDMIEKNPQVTVNSVCYWRDIYIQRE